MELTKSMRSFIVFVFFLFWSSISYSQMVKGTVLDEQTKDKIEFASIYFNGTFVGTTTDEEGILPLIFLNTNQCH